MRQRLAKEIPATEEERSPGLERNKDLLFWSIYSFVPHGTCSRLYRAEKRSVRKTALCPSERSSSDPLHFPEWSSPEARIGLILSVVIQRQTPRWRISHAGSGSDASNDARKSAARSG